MSNSIEIKKTPSGLYVPVKNNIFLHSAYDPIKEAQHFLDKHAAALLTKENVLVLGLGFGYHIDAIIDFCQNNHKSPNIFILEPDSDLIAQTQNLRQKQYLNVINIMNLNELFNSWEFVQLLISKPYLITHSASISANELYFKGFLTYQASNRLIDVTPNISEPMATEALKILTKFEDIKTQLEEKVTLSKEDYLLYALAEIQTQGREL